MGERALRGDGGIFIYLIGEYATTTELEICAWPDIHAVRCAFLQDDLAREIGRQNPLRYTSLSAMGHARESEEHDGPLDLRRIGRCAHDRII